MSRNPPPAPARGLAQELLELLIAERPDGAFREASELACLSLPVSEREAVRQALEMALHVRAVLEQRGRRELELAALYETAGDLSSLRELDQVLHAIVGRARELLSTDAAYITLIDEERGDTYMRVTAGIRTTAFKRVRLGLGEGLGGLVAQRHRAYATADYPSDSRFAHSAQVDTAVVGEGLVAILGVPMKLGRRVIGVLFAANRRERPFADDEVALLSSLAAHAAIAIENARLFQDAQEALRELTEANAVIQSNSETVERGAALHERLTALVLRGGGIADVAGALAEVLDGPLVVVNSDGAILTSAGDAPTAAWRSALADGVLPARGPGANALRHLIDEARGVGRTCGEDHWRGQLRRWATPVVAGSEQLGMLIFAGPAELAANRVRMLERGAQVMALLLLNERSVAEAEHRVRGDLLDDLLCSPPPDADSVGRRAQLLGVDLDRLHTVVAARMGATERRRLVAMEAAALATELGGLAGEHAGNIVLLLPGDQPDRSAATVARRLTAAAGQPMTIGAAGPTTGMTEVLEAYRDALRCQTTLLALGREGQWATPRDLGVYTVLLAGGSTEELERFVERTVGPLVRKDSARGSPLIETLETYFEADGNLARTAGRLSVHVNTLYQRLGRIDRLLGDGWRHGDSALQVHLALKVRRVMAQDGSPFGG